MLDKEHTDSKTLLRRERMVSLGEQQFPLRWSTDLNGVFSYLPVNALLFHVMYSVLRNAPILLVHVNTYSHFRFSIYEANFVSSSLDIAPRKH